MFIIHLQHKFQQLTHLSDETIKDIYKECVFSLNLDEIENPFCHEKGFSSRGSYPRQVIANDKTYNFSIDRVIFHKCGRAHTNFILPFISRITSHVVDTF